jgi:DUF1680 family protein
MNRSLTVALLLSLACTCGAAEVRSVSAPPPDRSTTLYPANRDPLAPSPFVKLPIGAITPKGWLRGQLDLMRTGMTGRLEEISPWCNFETSAWKDPRHGKNGWEEMPYWLKGYADLGYVTGDATIIAHSRKWIEAILASQDEDGWFGPYILKTSLKGKPDLWPHMLALNVLQSFYEYSNDPRVLPFMAKYFAWQAKVPDADFFTGYWDKMRVGDNIESIYWLYNRTGDKSLLDLAKRIHQHGARWDKGVANWHGVNFTQGFREPAIFSMQSKNPADRAAAYSNYDTAIGTYGQFPGGGFASDENARPGYADPRQGFETCSMVEFMHSFEMLTKITGDPTWADRTEEMAFNNLPASSTPDYRALHYLTGANMVQLDKANKAPGIENSGTMLSYSPFQVYRCCQHNISHGWPYFAEELWLATGDAGLCANLYSESEVSAKVADGETVKIVETTDYPFADKVTLKLALAKPVKFPLYLRVPKWTPSASVQINAMDVSIASQPPCYLVLEREWKDGDTVTLDLPMQTTLHTWSKNHNAVSVDRGPLTYSLKIGEKYQPYGKSKDWPEYEVYATTPWNYALVLDDKDPPASFESEARGGPLSANPFKDPPITLKAKGQRLPAWTLDGNNLLHTLQPSPTKSSELIESIELIPMGAARLRITAFPVIGRGPDAREWTIPPQPPKVSHCFASDTATALNDGLLPKFSNDHNIPRMTWWDHKGTTEWAEYDFDKPRKLNKSEVYWFDDETGQQKGACRTPASARLLYKSGNDWKEVSNASGYGVEKDKFNVTTFEPTATTAIRLEVKLKENFSGGILEWRVE